MKSALSVLSIGSEILDGRVQDTNSNFIAERLNSLGIPLKRVLSCDDDLEEICSCIRFLLQESSEIILSGGLGPTSDDLTREAVAHLLKVELVSDSAALKHIKDLFEARKRVFDPSNAKQALLPEGAKIISNPTGTAPGFQAAVNGAMLFAVPGVPSELKLMFEESIVPELKKRYGKAIVPRRHMLRVFGLTEAAVGSKVKGCKFEQPVVVSYRAIFPEIQVVLKAHVDLKSEIMLARQAIGSEYIFSEDPEVNFEGSLHNLLIEKKLSISTAESCSAGTAATLLTNTPGSSAYFMGGVNSYTNKSKSALLGVQAEIIEKHGAVSHETAKQMALGAQRVFSTDYAISITGIAGPDGGGENKPVGTFYVGVASPTGCESIACFYNFSRKRMRFYAAHVALDLVRRKILGLADGEYVLNRS